LHHSGSSWQRSNRQPPAPRPRMSSLQDELARVQPERRPETGGAGGDRVHDDSALLVGDRLHPVVPAAKGVLAKMRLRRGTHEEWRSEHRCEVVVAEAGDERGQLRVLGRPPVRTVRVPVPEMQARSRHDRCGRRQYRGEREQNEKRCPLRTRGEPLRPVLPYTTALLFSTTRHSRQSLPRAERSFNACLGADLPTDRPDRALAALGRRPAG
jgi:hypothetical protein